MSQYFEIHPETPQPRLIQQAVKIIREGGVVVYPTDSTYALGCAMGEKQALERIRLIRRLGNKHNFTLACRDLSEIGTYARIENTAYRLLKAFTPGPYTFVLRATGEVPRRLQHPKRKTIGIRVPDHPVARALLEALGEPLMSTSLLLPEQDDMPYTDPQDIREAIGKQVDLIIDAGPCGMEPSTVVDLYDGVPEVLRRGKGDASVFET
ncbi:tRNA threonylcarbamoyl adenosine modification protein (Sua5/YciO/YrdC/YwlC family) [Natronocella acetinitrilica]|jgi:tRNA threonylcarbamoyl adenosine modification protein (Sua5/YciO/YrdC/YwlC family)|uniref:tRNA threonylcarbamoyl adenosine modification protein (Sua5/YciO/YrdC/YwlC family) n=1 Tax=Natronocella acetinitrilica TaxID=414046 RepID=A0AAE3KAT8_9GAMM|nr:L-threonylcarbamoyladenylate synthase [Natronocella acetinitrilica]MCP1674780.1 tRNA threonylcarbamoyl adenosine modification protein (Sua5/YciO/YrdC/YwlC family) [Natronocella acetinitrilica]